MRRRGIISVGLVALLALAPVAWAVTGVVSGTVSSLTSQATADPADTGVVRMGNAESVCWEQSPADVTDMCLTVTAGEALAFNGHLLLDDDTTPADLAWLTVADLAAPASVGSGNGTDGADVLQLLAQGGGATASATANGGVGGAINVVGGPGGADTGVSATGAGGTGGGVYAIGGAAGSNTDLSSTLAGGTGGVVSLTAGLGGTITAGAGVLAYGGIGGAANLTAGAGGTATGDTTVGGAGGDIQVSPGAGGTGTAAAGRNGFISMLGSVAYQVNSPTSLSGNQNDYQLPSTSIIRLTASVPVTITGLKGYSGSTFGATTGSKAGHTITLVNIGTNPITLKDDSTSSSTNNRMQLLGDVALLPDQSVSLLHDVTTHRWRLVGASVPGATAYVLASFIHANLGGL